MTEFTKFRVIGTDEVVTYPAHFADHPVFGLNLELFDAEIEVDKVVTEGHELPVEQRASYFAVDVEDEDDDNEEEDE